MTVTNDFCYQTVEIWQIVGVFLSWARIIIPILLLIFGMLDFGRVVVSSKKEEMSKASSSLVKRIVAALFVFFLPLIITMVFDLVEPGDDYKVCLNCVTSPNGDDCENSKECIDENGNFICSTPAEENTTSTDVDNNTY